MKDHDDLKAWVQWAKKQPNMADEQPLFIKAIEDAISQAGMVPQLRTELDQYKSGALHTCHAECKNPLCVLRRERDQLRKELHQAKAEWHEETKRANELGAQKAAMLTRLHDIFGLKVHPAEALRGLDVNDRELLPDTPELPDDLIAAGTRAQWDWDGEAVDDRGAYYLGFVAGAKWQSEKGNAQ